MRVNDFEIKGDSIRRPEKTGQIIEMGHLGKEFLVKEGMEASARVGHQI